MGASLLPDFYAQKVNLFVALAPVGSTAHIPIPFVRWLAHHIRLAEYFFVDLLHMYNLFAPMDHLVRIVGDICSNPLAKGTCKDVIKWMHHDGVDDPVAGFTFLSHEPAGAGWRTIAYYGQMINSGRFELYDYGTPQNEKRYGTA
jgi:hypothetical protein